MKEKICVPLQVHMETADGVSLTQAGIDEALRNGKALAAALISLYSGSSSLTQETAKLFAQGANFTGEIILDKRLGWNVRQPPKDKLSLESIKKLQALNSEAEIAKFFLATGFTRPDHGTVCSAEIALGVLEVVKEIFEKFPGDNSFRTYPPQHILMVDFNTTVQVENLVFCSIHFPRCSFEEMHEAKALGKLAALERACRFDDKVEIIFGDDNRCSYLDTTYFKRDEDNDLCIRYRNDYDCCLGGYVDLTELINNAKELIRKNNPWLEIK